LDVSPRQIEVYVETTRRGTLTRAAEALGISQSAASLSLADLERNLGGPLFLRVGRRLVPNARGRNLLSHAEAILRAMEDFATRAGERGEPEGVLLLGCSTTVASYALPRRIKALHDRYPRLDVRLWVGNTEDVARRVRTGDADVGVVEGEVDDPGLREEPWMLDELAVVVSPLHPAAEEPPLEALLRETWVLRERGSGTRSTLEAALRREGLRLTRILEIGHTEAIKGVVGAGLGVGCLSLLAVEREIREGLLVRLRVPLELSRRFRILTPTESPGRLADLVIRRLREETEGGRAG